MAGRSVSRRSSRALTALVAASVASLAGAGALLAATPSLSIADVRVTEVDNDDFVPGRFRVSLSAAATRSITVNYATEATSATSGRDYTAKSGTLTFWPGQTVKTIIVTVKGDTLDENTERFIVRLSAPAGATIADGVGVGTILDDDPLPFLSLSDRTVYEGDSGTVSARFYYGLNVPSGRNVTVTYRTEPITADASDYDDVMARVTFSPGQMLKSFYVPVHGDTLDEETETFHAELVDPVNALLAEEQMGTGTILDDDP